MSSAWNQLSGNWMWEERSYTEVVKKRYPELFVAALKRVGDEAGLNAVGSVSVRGDTDALVLVLHGRLRFVLDMDDLRVDVCMKRGEETLFDGVIAADELSTDEGDEVLKKTPVRIRESRTSTEEGKKTICDIVRKSLATAVFDLREEILSKAASAKCVP